MKIRQIIKTSYGIVLPVLIFTIVGCASSMPQDLGPRNGYLKPCPASLNCVNSFFRDHHYIEPIEFETTPRLARRKFLNILKKHYSARIKTVKDWYAHAVVTTTLGFKDDLEILVKPEKKIIHVRSESRIGNNDLGVNRVGIGFIRSKFNESSTSY